MRICDLDRRRSFDGPPKETLLLFALAWPITCSRHTGRGQMSIQNPASSLPIGNRTGANLWSDRHAPAWHGAALRQPTREAPYKPQPATAQPGRPCPGRRSTSNPYVHACIPGNPKEKPWRIQNLKTPVPRCHRDCRRGAAGTGIYWQQQPSIVRGMMGCSCLVDAVDARLGARPTTHGVTHDPSQITPPWLVPLDRSGHAEPARSLGLPFPLPLAG